MNTKVVLFSLLISVLKPTLRAFCINDVRNFVKFIVYINN